MTTAKALLVEKTEITKSPKRYTLEEYFILEERNKTNTNLETEKLHKGLEEA